MYGDDFIIESTFPGGHKTLIDTIISSKMRFDCVVREYNSSASTYEKSLRLKSVVFEIWESLIDRFDYSGTVLDLGCGTGLIGTVVKRKYNAKFTGIDVTPEMVKLVNDYERVHIGLIENVMFELQSSFTHIVSAGVLSFVDTQYFEKIFSKMFQLASNSVSLVIDDVSDEYKELCAKNYAVIHFNHVETIENFPIPPGWCLVYKKRQFFWVSPRTGTQMYGLVLRYENSATSVDAKK